MTTATHYSHDRHHPRPLHRLALLLPLIVTAAACEGPTYSDPANAGPDFAAQGEYVGQIDGQPWGAQVIARGAGEFEMALYEGGLPGAGGLPGESRPKPVRITAAGMRRGNTVTFRPWGMTIRIDGDTMTIDRSSAAAPAVLRKTHRESPTLNAPAPPGAIVLFDGSSTDHWHDATLIEGHLLAPGCRTKQSFADHRLHIEFRIPFRPFARGQARGNSGVYVQDRYEIQVLDSFGRTPRSNDCGGIYRIAAPAVNACLPPLTWQTYDIDFTAARHDAAGRKTANARVTVRHNGVLIHDDLELPHATPGRAGESPAPGPLYLQHHRNPVAYRNIWLVPLNADITPPP